MIVIRECRGFDELQACVDMEVEVWGYNDGDVIARRVFLVAQKIGGQVIGAFDTGNGEQGTGIGEQGTGNREQGSGVEKQGTGNREQGSGVRGQQSENGDQGDASSLIGFSFSLPGAKTDSESGRPEPYLHSHMLAVRDGYRNQKIGARLKLAQREDALKRGFGRIEWTFDPVEIKNAFLNIHKLGAIVRRYEENFYGVSSSRLQGGLQTDRLVAEWWIGTPHVEAAIEGRPAADTLGESWLEEIRVPAAIYQWKAEDADRHLARELQAENRQRFQEAFSRGLAVVAFTRDAAGNGTFHLGRWNEPSVLHGKSALNSGRSRPAK